MAGRFVLRFRSERRATIAELPRVGHAAVLASPPRPNPGPAQTTRPHRGPMVIMRRQASPQQDRENDLQRVDNVLQHVTHLLLPKGIAYGNNVA
jgi:hypothetical protein